MLINIMNNLKCRKQGFNKIICRKTNKEISFSDCNSCSYKEYKASQNKTIKKRSYSLAKKEKQRYSIIVKDLDKCVICGKKRDNLHEIFFGKNRQNSITYGLVIPLCYSHHVLMHKDSKLQHIWHIIGQTKFEEHYPDLNFLEIFGKNYK